MIKFKKAYNLKLVSILAAVIFCLNNTAYGIDLSNKSKIRVPLLTKERTDEALSDGNKEDVTISSAGTNEDHESYNTRVTQNGRLLDDIAIEIGATRGSPEEDWDFRQAITRLLQEKDSRVQKHASRNIIVTLEENSRYLIMTTEKDTITGERELVIIDPRFGGDHAGRTRNQVYARDLAKAVHELVELRIWKAIEKRRKIEIDPAGRDGKPRNIKEWTQSNISYAVQADKIFHSVATRNERSFIDWLDRIDSQDRLGHFLLFIGQLDHDIKKNAKRNPTLEEELAEYSRVTSFNEMVRLFDSMRKTKVELSRRPRVDELMYLSVKPYEVQIIQRKTTGKWYATRGEEERVSSSLAWYLRGLNDVAVKIHSHNGGEIEPPSPLDFIMSLLRNSPEHLEGVGDVKYFYTYSTKNLGSAETIDLDELLEEMDMKYEELEGQIVEEIRGDRFVDVPEGVGDAAYNRFYELWKAYVESLGFTMDLITWEEFGRDPDSVYVKITDTTPAIEIEDVIISSEPVQKPQIRDIRESL